MDYRIFRLTSSTQPFSNFGIAAGNAFGAAGKMWRATSDGATRARVRRSRRYASAGTARTRCTSLRTAPGTSSLLSLSTTLPSRVVPSRARRACPKSTRVSSTVARFALRAGRKTLRAAVAPLWEEVIKVAVTATRAGRARATGRAAEAPCDTPPARGPATSSTSSHCEPYLFDNKG